MACSQSEELAPSDPKQDDHKQRIIDLLTPVALGEVPSGFSLQQDRLSRIPASEQSPCNFNMYAKLGQRLVGSRELIDVILVKTINHTVKSLLISSVWQKALLQVLYLIKHTCNREKKQSFT